MYPLSKYLLLSLGTLIDVASCIPLKVGLLTASDVIFMTVIPLEDKFLHKERYFILSPDISPTPPMEEWSGDFQHNPEPSSAYSNLISLHDAATFWPLLVVLFKESANRIWDNPGRKCSFNQGQKLIFCNINRKKERLTWVKSWFLQIYNIVFKLIISSHACCIVRLHSLSAAACHLFVIVTGSSWEVWLNLDCVVVDAPNSKCKDTAITALSNSIV